MTLVAPRLRVEKETRFLVDAMAEATARLPPPAAARPKTVKADLIWTMELFATLAGRERSADPAG